MDGSGSCRRWSRVVSLIFALSLSASDAGRASCVWVPWASPPSGSVIPRNPLIALGRGDDLEIASYRPYLASAGDSVPLVERERFAAHMPGLVSFEPKRLLRPHTRYVLRFHRAPEDRSLPTGEWTTSEVADFSAPLWTGEPAVDLERSKVGGIFGYQVAFNLPVGDSEGATWAVLEVESLTDDPLFTGGGQRRLWNLPENVRDSGLRVEQGECGDDLGLRSGNPYRLRLVLLDKAGNRSAAKEVRFRLPRLPYPVGEVHTWVPVETVLSKVEPNFVQIFRQQRGAGSVEGHLIVDETGAVTEVTVETTLPLLVGALPFVERSTTEALRQWRFPPSAIKRTLPFKTFYFFAPPVFVPDWSAD